MANLDEKVVGKAINNNASFLTNLVGNLDPASLGAAVNEACQANPAFMRNLIANLDAQKMAKLMHDEHLAEPDNDFLSRMMGAIYSTPGATIVIANAIKGNEKFLSDFMAGSDPTVIADLVNSDNVSGVPGGLLIQLLGSGGINASTIAATMNAHPVEMGKVLARMPAATLTSAINANPNMVADLLAMLDPSVLVAAGPDDSTSLFQNMRITLSAKARLPLILGGGWLAAPGYMWVKYITDHYP